VSPVKVKEMIDEWCNAASERLTGDPELWKHPQYDKKIAPWIVEKEVEFLLGDLTGHCEVMFPYLEHYGINFGTTEDVGRWLEAATGITYSPDELRATISRVRLLIDSYNVLCARASGERFAEAKPVEQLFAFPAAGRPTDAAGLRHVQKDYCAIRGYDPDTGIPLRERLESVGLGDVADRLETTVGQQVSHDKPTWWPKDLEDDATRSLDGPRAS
jgi:aldehyde:ferredoxin oxidoreductase